MKLFGTTTSPFVRRVRVVAAEVGEVIERVDTAGEAGQAALRDVSPIGKVPVAIVDGRAAPLFDSRAIIDWLVEHRGRGELARRDRYDELDRTNAIDAAIEAMMQLMLLRRDGVAVDGTAYARRQLDRTAAIFAWLDARAPFGDGLALSEISLVCALDWMAFRALYPVERAGANVLAVHAAWRDRPSLASTRPHA